MRNSGGLIKAHTCVALVVINGAASAFICPNYLPRLACPDWDREKGISGSFPGFPSVKMGL